MNGRFVTFEGGEGTGKSTQIKLLAQRLEGLGIETIVTREPGGSVGAEQIRELLVTGDPDRWSPMTEALLLFAARSDHLDRTIRPALAQGKWVLCDRFYDSTMAYQGHAGGIGADTVQRLIEISVGETHPDLTLVFDLPVEAGLARAHAISGEEVRFENKGKEFHEQMRQAYLQIADENPKRCAVIDASGDIDQVSELIWRSVYTRYSAELDGQ